MRLLIWILNFNFLNYHFSDFHSFIIFLMIFWNVVLHFVCNKFDEQSYVTNFCGFNLFEKIDWLSFICIVKSRDRKGSDARLNLVGTERECWIYVLTKFFKDRLFIFIFCLLSWIFFFLISIDIFFISFFDFFCAQQNWWSKLFHKFLPPKFSAVCLCRTREF